MAAMPKRVTDNPWSLLAHLDVAAGSKTDPVLAFLPWGKDSGGAAGPKCVEARELASLQGEGTTHNRSFYLFEQPVF